MQRVVVDVVDDAADMIGVPKHLLRRHRCRVHPIDDRVAVRPVLGDGHEDVTAVVVDAPGVIDRAFTDQEIADELAQGIIISLEQVENYPKQSAREDDPVKQWRNRNRRIADAEEKVLDKWMPADLMDIARRNANS